MSQIAWDFYLKKVQDVITQYGPVDILKTDANNEAYDHPTKGGIVNNIEGAVKFKQIEYSNEVIRDALEKMPSFDIDQGDIRSLPYSDNSFDMVLDLSTIDHVGFHEVNSVINEYIRVVRNNGLIFLVVWCANSREDITHSREWDCTAQYYFWYDDIKKYLKEEGAILEEEVVQLMNIPWHIIPSDAGIHTRYALKYILMQVDKVKQS